MNTQAVMTEAVAVVKRPVGRPVTKQTLRRVVLLDGAPVGRGRPIKGSKQNRTVVFVPINETYSVAKHGTGVKFAPKQKQFKVSIKRVDLEKFIQLAKTPVVI